MSSIRAFRWLVVVCGGIALGACSSDGNASAEGAQASSATSATRTDARRDPCSLITKEEAEAILSDVFIVRPGSDASSCEYVPAQGRRLNGFVITVHWKGGKEALSVVKSSNSIATDLMTKGDAVDMSSLMSLEPVEGLGDEAYFNPMAGSSVLKDDTLLEFDIQGMMWHRKRGEGRERWKELVAKALSRL